jgi:hypothetical protein
MESLCQIKIPPHVFEALVENKDLMKDHLMASEKKESEA